MATATSNIHVTDLPNEVMENIFSYLRLSDRKAASLVCLLWNELIFSRRSMCNVVLNIIMDWEHSQISVLKRSTRIYRNFFAFFGPETCCDYDFTIIVAILDLFGTSIESFHCMSNLTVTQLWNVILRAPNLCQLIVGVDTASLEIQQPEFPILPHLRDMGSLINLLRIKQLDVPNLRQLSANFIKADDALESFTFLRQVAPRLKNLELFSTKYYVPINELQFPEVEVLKLCGEICDAKDSVLQQFFAGFRSLTDVHLDFNVDSIVLDVITKNCPGIAKLHFRTYRLDSESFQLLERLKCLKTLSLTGTVKFHTTVQCRPLVSVEKLHWKMCNFDFDAGPIVRLARIVPNVVDMGITFMTFSRPDCILALVCQNFPHLKRFSISDDAMERHTLSNQLFQALKHLYQLEELTLKCIDTPVAFMLPNTNLKRLKIKYFHRLSDSNLIRLAQMYPNLKYLELSWCRKITQSGIAKFQSKLTDCVVHHSKLYV